MFEKDCYKQVYDEQGNCLSVTVFNNTKHKYSWVASYDKDGNVISITHGENPKDIESFVATYDEKGNRTSMIFGKDPKHEYSWKATYDQDGNVISRIYGEDPKSLNSWVATYDEDGFCLTKKYGENPKHYLSTDSIDKKIKGELLKKENKSKLGLLPGCALEMIADVMNEAAIQKYDYDSWKELNDEQLAGMVHATLRHAYAHADGQESRSGLSFPIDPEFGRTHLAHLGACVLIQLWAYNQRKK